MGPATETKLQEERQEEIPTPRYKTEHETEVPWWHYNGGVGNKKESVEKSGATRY
jgi:hypothetical protein